MIDTCIKWLCFTFLPTLYQWFISKIYQQNLFKVISLNDRSTSEKCHIICGTDQNMKHMPQICSKLTISALIFFFVNNNINLPIYSSNKQILCGKGSSKIQLKGEVDQLPQLLSMTIELKASWIACWFCLHTWHTQYSSCMRGVLILSFYESVLMCESCTHSHSKLQLCEFQEKDGKYLGRDISVIDEVTADVFQEIQNKNLFDHSCKNLYNHRSS